MTTVNCPLCDSKQIIGFHQDKQRTFLRCKTCMLVFVAPEYLPSKEQELKEYALHQNSLEDEGYLSFLSRMVNALQPYLKPGNYILDYGCGPCHALAHLFELQGYSVDCFDPLFGPTAIKKEQYDVITATESIEHFHRPIHEWERWMDLLKPGGWLGIMTKRVANVERFSNWHYKNDTTHVSFFSVETFTWLAKEHQLNVLFPERDIVLLQKPAE